MLIPSDSGLFLVRCFLVTASISLGVIGLFKSCIWSWFNFGKWYLSRKLSISFRVSNLVAKRTYPGWPCAGALRPPQLPLLRVSTQLVMGYAVTQLPSRGPCSCNPSPVLLELILVNSLDYQVGLWRVLVGMGFWNLRAYSQWHT